MAYGGGSKKKQMTVWYRRALSTVRALAFLECETKNKNNVLLLLVKGSLASIWYMAYSQCPKNDRLCGVCGCEIFS